MSHFQLGFYLFLIPVVEVELYRNFEIYRNPLKYNFFKKLKPGKFNDAFLFLRNVEVAAVLPGKNNSYVCSLKTYFC